MTFRGFPAWQHQQSRLDETRRDLQSILNKKAFHPVICNQYSTKSISPGVCCCCIHSIVLNQSSGRFADWLLQSQREEEHYSISWTSKRGADFDFEFQTDPVDKLIEVRKGVNAQVGIYTQREQQAAKRLPRLQTPRLSSYPFHQQYSKLIARPTGVSPSSNSNNQSRTPARRSPSSNSNNQSRTPAWRLPLQQHQ